MRRPGWPAPPDRRRRQVRLPFPARGARRSSPRAPRSPCASRNPRQARPPPPRRASGTRRGRSVAVGRDRDQLVDERRVLASHRERGPERVAGRHHRIPGRALVAQPGDGGAQPGRRRPVEGDDLHAVLGERRRDRAPRLRPAVRQQHHAVRARAPRQAPRAIGQRNRARLGRGGDEGAEDGEPSVPEEHAARIAISPMTRQRRIRTPTRPPRSDPRRARTASATRR